MSETTEIEVDQVWQHNIYKDTITILAGFSNGCKRGCVYLRKSHESGRLSGGDILEQGIRNHYTLIQDAKGSLIKQWKEINAYEGMVLVGTAGKPIPCQMRDNTDDYWQDRTLNCTTPRHSFPFSDTSENDWVFCRVEVKESIKDSKNELTT